MSSLCIFFAVKESDPALDFLREKFERGKWDVSLHRQNEQSQIMIVTANFMALKIAAERYASRGINPWAPLRREHFPNFVLISIFLARPVNNEVFPLFCLKLGQGL